MNHSHTCSHHPAPFADEPLKPEEHHNSPEYVFQVPEIIFALLRNGPRNEIWILRDVVAQLRSFESAIRRRVVLPTASVCDLLKKRCIHPRILELNVHFANRESSLAFPERPSSRDGASAKLIIPFLQAIEGSLISPSANGHENRLEFMSPAHHLDFDIGVFYGFIVFIIDLSEELDAFAGVVDLLCCRKTNLLLIFTRGEPANRITDEGLEHVLHVAETRGKKFPPPDAVTQDSK